MRGTRLLFGPVEVCSRHQHEIFLLPGYADGVLMVRQVQLLRKLDAATAIRCFAKHAGAAGLLGMPARINGRMDPQVPCDFGIPLQLLEASAVD